MLWKWRVRRVPSLCYFHVKRPFLRNHLLCLFLPLLAHGKSAFSPPSEISDGTDGNFEEILADDGSL